MAKNILLIGQSGQGKSAFVNCIAGLHDKPEIQLSRESDSFESCTDDIRPFALDRTPIGPVNIIDTQGLNDTRNKLSDNEILLKVLIHFYKNNLAFQIDAILYLTTSKCDRFHYKKDMELFSKVFDYQDTNSVTSSVIFVFTNYNELKYTVQIDKLISEKMDFYGRPVIKWDSKIRLENQFSELNRALADCPKYSIKLNLIANEINNISQNLRENEKEVINPLKITPCRDNKQVDLKHTENISEAGTWSIVSLGTTAIMSKTHKEKFLLNPPYPNDCQNRRISNIRYEVVNKKDIKDYNFNFVISDTEDYANIYSDIKFSFSLFGNASIDYKVTYDYSYDIVTPNENPSYSYKSLESYMKKAENIYFDEKLKSTRNNNYVEI